MSKEISYYPEIMQFLKEQIVSNFSAKYGRKLYVESRIGELKKGLQDIIVENPEQFSCLKDFYQNVPPLNLDIFTIITDSEKYEILISEIKDKKNVGLNEWSQLVGYCIVSKAKFGVLINVNGDSSTRLKELLNSDINLSYIQREVAGKKLQHSLGMMTWRSSTRNLEYSNLGCMKNISQICDIIHQAFTS